MSVLFAVFLFACFCFLAHVQWKLGAYLVIIRKVVIGGEHVLIGAGKQISAKGMNN